MIRWTGLTQMIPEVDLSATDEAAAVEGVRRACSEQVFEAHRLCLLREGMCCGPEAGSFLRLIDSCITQLKAQGPSRTCNESKEEEEEEEGGGRAPRLLRAGATCSDPERPRETRPVVVTTCRRRRRPISPTTPTDPSRIGRLREPCQVRPPRAQQELCHAPTGLVRSVLVEQQPPQGVVVCDHAGLVINKFSPSCRGAEV